MHCPCCGAELGLVEVQVEPVIEREESVRATPSPRPSTVVVVHSKEETRWAVRVIKASKEELFFDGAKIVWAFSSRGLMVQTAIGLYRVRDWLQVKNRAGRPVLLDLWFE